LSATEVTPVVKREPPQHPAPFLEVRVQNLDIQPGLTAVCAGYEQGRWRAARLAGHMIEWLPDFVLRESEREGLRAENAVALIAKAAQTVYTSDKYERRGEPGELLLHIILRQEFKTIPAVAKLFFKDSTNDTVKGFDAVHVVASQDRLELWLGEVKFYEDITAAIHDVVQELTDHSDADYLRREFAAITNKIDPAWPYAERLKKLLNPNTSLDDVFDCICVPVLLTYDSPTLAAHDRVTAAFKAAFEAEVVKHHGTFASRPLPSELRINLFLLPMNRKSHLLHEFHKRLKNVQGIA
jgi:hypothetical protein